MTGQSIADVKAALANSGLSVDDSGRVTKNTVEFSNQTWSLITEAQAKLGVDNPHFVLEAALSALNQQIERDESLNMGINYKTVAVASIFGEIAILTVLIFGKFSTTVFTYLGIAAALVGIIIGTVYMNHDHRNEC